MNWKLSVDIHFKIQVFYILQKQYFSLHAATFLYLTCSLHFKDIINGDLIWFK